MVKGAKIKFFWSQLIAMSKSQMRSIAQINRFFKVVFIFVCFVSVFSAQAMQDMIDCRRLPLWNANAIYLQGDRLVLNGTVYQAVYLNQNSNPTQNLGDWEQWKILGPCKIANKLNGSVETHLKIKIPPIW